MDNPDPMLQSAKRSPVAIAKSLTLKSSVVRSGGMIQLGCSRRGPSGTHVAHHVEARALARHPDRSIQGATCKCSVVSYSARQRCAQMMSELHPQTQFASPASEVAFVPIKWDGQHRDQCRQQIGSTRCPLLARSIGSDGLCRFCIQVGSSPCQSHPIRWI
jgi:hypothetical protein